jgi:hypothetical protein
VKRWPWLALALGLALVVGAWRWRTSSVVLPRADAGARAVPKPIVPNTDPTAASALEISAAGAAMIAVQGKTYRRAFGGERTLIDDVPLGEYDVFASGPDGSAHAKVAVVEHETTRVVLKLALEPGAVALRGTVRDILGGTVAGAEVWVDFTIARTDATGEFETHVPPGEHRVLVRAAGYAETTTQVTFRIDHRIEVVLHPAATMSGVVVHADGTIAGGARVVIVGRDGFDTFADPEGKFTFEGLPGGSYVVRASTASEIGIAEHVALAPAGTRDVRIELTGAIAVFGRVLGVDGAAIPGAKVTLEGERHLADAEAISGADGSYRFTPVLPGAVVVEACADGYLCSTAPSRYYVKTPAAPLDVVLGAGAVLRLHIVDANGAPVAGADAYLGEFEGCESGADGDCVIDHLHPRRTKVTADHPTAGHVSDELLDVGPGETRHLLRLVRGGTVRGTVRWDDGKPAVNVEVSDGLLSSRASTHTDATGRYELTNVDARFAEIRAHASERGDKSMLPWLEMDPSGGAKKTITVAPGEVREGVDLVLRRESTTIAGTVVDASGAPVANAAVGLLKESEFFDIRSSYSFMFKEPLTYAGADGTFTIENVADAEYIVWASAEDQPRGIARHVKAGASKTLVKMPGGAVVEGIVQDERGAPVTRFDVRLADVGSDRRQRVFDAGGRFVWKGLSEGKHAFAVEGALQESGATCVVPVDAKAGETSHVTCTLERSVTVTGRFVTWPDGRPIPGVRVSAEGAVRRESEASDADGRIRIENVGVGDIRLHTFDALGHGDSWKRKVGQANPFDLGELAVGEKRGYVFIRTLVGFDMEVLSIDGQDTTKLGAESLSGALEAAREGAPIVGKKPDGETTTVLRPAHRAHAD